MLQQPRFTSHADQQAMLGCAAKLDPKKHPRRYALMQARQKGTRIVTQREGHDQRYAERKAIAERAVFYTDLPMSEAAPLLGVRYEYLREIRDEFNLNFPSFNEWRANQKNGGNGN